MSKIKKAQNYLLQFMERHKLLPDSDRALVAVSGGVDSMFLLALLARLRDSGAFKSLEAVHINHGTRDEAVREEELVESFCQFHKVQLHKFKLSLSLETSDFENTARKERYSIFRSLLHAGDKLYLGHHIDDSFEWSLLSQFRSGSVAPAVGIPVLNGQYARPLMCFTKGQIYHLADIMKVPFSEDASNENIDFDRNYIRSVVVPRIAKRYPAYLKHYVYRSNQLCHKLGTHIQDRADCTQFTDSLGAVHLIQSKFQNDFSGNEDRVLSIVQSLSSELRGALSLQVKKLIEKARSGKGGPILFSGDVCAYIYPGHMIFASGETLFKIADFDQKVSETLKNRDLLELHSLDTEKINTIMLKTIENQGLHLVFSADERASRVIKGQRSLDPLFPETSREALDQGLWFRPIVQYLNYLRKLRGSAPKVRILRDKDE